MPTTHPRNHDGSAFTALVSRLTDAPSPGSDEISKAFEEAWIGKAGYANGVRQRRLTRTAEARRHGAGQKGTSASGVMPRPAGMCVTTTAREAAATRIRIKSPARTTPRAQAWAKLMARVGGGVSARVPSVWRRHPADRLHHRSRTHSEDSHGPRRAARTAANLAGPLPVIDIHSL